MTNHATAWCGWLSAHPPTEQPLARLFFFSKLRTFVWFQLYATSPPRRLAVLLSVELRAYFSACWLQRKLLDASYYKRSYSTEWISPFWIRRTRKGKFFYNDEKNQMSANNTMYSLLQLAADSALNMWKWRVMLRGWKNILGIVHRILKMYPTLDLGLWMSITGSDKGQIQVL